MFFLVMIFFSKYCLAQEIDDYSSSLLLNTPEVKENMKTRLESGRYQHKPPMGKEIQRVPKNEMDISQSKLNSNLTKNSNEKNNVRKPSSVDVGDIPSERENKTVKEKENSTVENANHENDSQGPEIQKKENDNYYFHFKEAFSGDRPYIQEYLNSIKHEDRRFNKIELSAKMGYLYNSSISNFSYRNYYVASPLLDFMVSIWPAPLFGISIKTNYTIDGSIQNVYHDNDKVLAQFQSYFVGLEFRKYYSDSYDSPYFEYGLHYEDSRFVVPNDELSRLRLKSAGWGVHFQMNLPQSKKYFHLVGGFINPKMSHTEDSALSNIQSGSNPESHKIGCSFGGEWLLTSRDQFNWVIALFEERNQFLGEASVADPITAETPQFVSVMNSGISFTFGYRWGK